MRQFLFEREIVIPQQEEFVFTYLSDGLSKGRVIRPVQTNYGVSICGESFSSNTSDVNERKFQKALQVVERDSCNGCDKHRRAPVL